MTTTAQGMGAEDARSMDQRRADTLVDLLLGRTEPAIKVFQDFVAGLNARVEVAASDDLANWQPLASGLAVVSLQERRAVVVNAGDRSVVLACANLVRVQV